VSDTPARPIHHFDPDVLTGLLAGGMPPRWVRGLLATFPDPDAWRAAPLRPGEDPAWRLLPRKDSGSTALVLGTESYPWMFAALAAPPPVLYVEGDESLLGPAIGIIGSREITALGAAVASVTARHAVALNAPVVTGLARGVDEHAARTVINEQGKVIGVVGASFDRLDDRAAALTSDVLRGDGALACEVPPGTTTSRNSLLARNRLIAALACPLLVAEASLTSGTLACARDAVEMLTPLVVPVPRPSARLQPGAQGLLVLAGLTPRTLLHWPARLFDRYGPDGFANAVCESGSDINDALKVFWWLRPRTPQDITRRLELLTQERVGANRSPV
jgi:DNA protecting protein DprA